MKKRFKYCKGTWCAVFKFLKSPLFTVKKSLEDSQDEKRSQEELAKKLQADNDDKLRKLTEEANGMLMEKESELQSVRDRESDLNKRVHGLTAIEDELRDKFHSSELEFSEKLQHASMRERELLEKISQITKHLEEVKIHSDEEKRELEEKLNRSADEITIMKTTRSASRNSSLSESFQNKTLTTSQTLLDEVESLRCVLELKQNEISELRKSNCELQRVADVACAAQIKCSALESRVEDLQVQLHAKNEEEKWEKYF